MTAFRANSTYRDLTGALLVLSVCDLAVIEDHSPATVAVTHTRLPAMLFGEECLGIAQEQHLVALDAIDLAPRVHDPRIVARNRGDDVNALLAEFGCLLDVRRQVVRLAAGCEGAGNAEDDDLLVGPFLGGIEGLGTAAGSRVGISNGCPSVCC